MSVSCAACDQAHPAFCPRCTYLMGITHTWRKVALLEHVQHCNKQGDHETHIEQTYNLKRHNG